MINKRALVVGIDHYSKRPLNGCVADAVAMNDILSTNEDTTRNYSVRVVTSDKEVITRSKLRTLLSELFENTREAQVMFYFSGHGIKTPWGAELVTQDFEPNSMGVSMNDVITIANESPANEVLIILDCCFSGDLGNTPGAQASATSEAFRHSISMLREGVTLLTASRSIEPSMEVDGHGAFTSLILDGLEGAAADHVGNVTALSLYDFASRAFDAWEQRPVFKSHVTKPCILRKCNPPIDRALLLQLPSYFANPADKYQLSPRHEGTRPIPHGTLPTPEQVAFDYLKSLRNAGLVTVEDGKDLYWASLDSGRAQLTPTGKYFWTLAKNGKL